LDDVNRAANAASKKIQNSVWETTRDLPNMQDISQAADKFVETVDPKRDNNWKKMDSGAVPKAAGHYDMR